MWFMSFYIPINTESFFENMSVFLNVHVSKILYYVQVVVNSEKKIIIWTSGCTYPIKSVFLHVLITYLESQH